MDQPQQAFYGDALRPVAGTFDVAAMATGEPGLPRQFYWRGEILEIQTVLRRWRETGRCTHGSAEAYVRKHWFEVKTTTNQQARLYFERRPRSGQQTQRWWLYSMTEEAAE